MNVSDKIYSHQNLISAQICEDCSDKKVLIDVLRDTITSKSKLIVSLRKELEDSERLIKLIRGQKQILSDKNAALLSGDLPKVIKKRIVEDTLKGKHL